MFAIETLVRKRNESENKSTTPQTRRISPNENITNYWILNKCEDFNNSLIFNNPNTVILRENLVRIFFICIWPENIHKFSTDYERVISSQLFNIKSLNNFLTRILNGFVIKRFYLILFTPNNRKKCIITQVFVEKRLQRIHIYGPYIYILWSKKGRPKYS